MNYEKCGSDCMAIFQASYIATWLKHAETASVKPKRDSDFGLFRVVSFHRFRLWMAFWQRAARDIHLARSAPAE